MITRKKMSILAVCAVAAGLLAASPAFADNSGTLPSGCSISPTSPTLKDFVVNGSTKKEIGFGGSANCPASTSADFRLVRDFSGGVPDNRVRQTNWNNATGSGSYSHYDYTCDNGGTGDYYSEIRLYVSGSPQRVSATKTLTNHC